MLKKTHKNNTGANLAEMSLVLPVALIVIYALIYFSFTLVIEGAAESAIHTALDKATIQPALENIPESIPDNCDDYAPGLCSDPENEDDETVQFCCAMTEIVGLAKSKAQGSFMGANYDSSTFAYFSPSDGSGKEIRMKFPEETEDHVPAHLNPIAAYQDKPIVMEMDFAIRPIFPGLPAVQRTVRAVAFYEVQSSLSYPIPVDCMGNAYGSSDYDLSSCVCLKKAGGPQGKNENNQCVVCDNGATPYIEGHPEFGVRPENSDGSIRNGCWCPRSSWCNDKYGLGGTQHNNSSNCECVCTTWYGVTGVYEGGSGSNGGELKNCKCAGGGGSIQGNTETITFKPEREVRGGTCKCVKPDGSTLTHADCDRLFPSAAGNIVADKDGCSCRCKYGGNDGTDGNQCFDSVWGTEWAPQASYAQLRAGDTCDCQCTTWSGGHHVVTAQAYNASSGKCECMHIKDDPGNTCQNGGSGTGSTFVAYDYDCNCKCDKANEETHCGAEAHLDDNCQCVCNSEVDTFTGHGSCVATGGGSGGLG